jgi:succinate-semialdehyde dehydrogenase/glutarate-semialdehyde dehydrogenase
MAITSINPTTGETLKDFSAFNESQIEKALSRAEQAFEHYRRTPFARRAQWLMGAATLL